MYSLLDHNTWFVHRSSGSLPGVRDPIMFLSPGILCKALQDLFCRSSHPRFARGRGCISYYNYIRRALGIYMEILPIYLVSYRAYCCCKSLFDFIDIYSAVFLYFIHIIVLYHSANA